MASSRSRDGCSLNHGVLVHTLVLTLAGLLIINSCIGSAWAEKGGKGGKKDNEVKGHKEKTSESGTTQHHDAGKVKNAQNAGSVTTETQAKNSPPPPSQQQSSPPPQQGDPPTNSTNNQEGQTVQPAQDPQNVPPRMSSQNDRTAAESISITDSIGRISANSQRHINDKIGVEDGGGRNDGVNQLSSLLKKSTAPIVIGSELRVTDKIAVSGMNVIPSTPRITVTSPPMLQVSGDQRAEITFDSTAAGTYSVLIRSDFDTPISQTLSGQMLIGANSVTWDGKMTSGELMPAGQYTYFITATGDGGVRHPPQKGDGEIIVVAAPSQPPGASFAPLDSIASIFLIIAIAGSAAAFLLLVLRKNKKSITIYLPNEATAAVSNLNDMYPYAIIEDYFEPTAEGPKRYVGITIPYPKDGDNDQWQSEVTEKVKEIAGVDSLHLMTRGKLQVL